MNLIFRTYSLFLLLKIRHQRLFTYLLDRNYLLFHAVRAHIFALYDARRQLIDQDLGLDELVALRRDCVARLVKGNVEQGLEVIVRYPTKGSLVTVGGADPVNSGDGKRTEKGAGAVSGVKMFLMQVVSYFS